MNHLAAVVFALIISSYRIHTVESRAMAKTVPTLTDFEQINDVLSS